MKHTHQTKPLEIPTPGFGVFFNYGTITSIRKGDVCKTILWESVMNVILTAHVWKRVLCVLHMKKASEWEGEQVCVVCGWRVLCIRGQGFPHNTVWYHYLVSPFFLCQLCITFQSRQREEQKENARLKLRKRRRRRNFANKDLKKKSKLKGKGDHVLQ